MPDCDEKSLDCAITTEQNSDPSAGISSVSNENLTIHYKVYTNTDIAVMGEDQVRTYTCGYG